MRRVGAAQFDAGRAREREGAVVRPARGDLDVLSRYLRARVQTDGHSLLNTKVMLDMIHIVQFK